MLLSAGEADSSDLFQLPSRIRPGGAAPSITPAEPPALFLGWPAGLLTSPWSLCPHQQDVCPPKVEGVSLSVCSPLSFPHLSLRSRGAMPGNAAEMGLAFECAGVLPLPWLQPEPGPHSTRASALALSQLGSCTLLP